MCTDQYARLILEYKATVHLRYTFSLHPVYLLCTGRVRAADGSVHKAFCAVCNIFQSAIGVLSLSFE